MNPIVATIKQGDTGSTVTNLLNALLLLVSNKVIYSVPTPGHPNVDELQGCVTKAQAELTKAIFADNTRQLVTWFQSEQNLNSGQSAGTVDAATAAALNAALTKLNALPAATSVVSGRVYSSTSLGIGGLQIEVVDRNVGNDVILAEGISNSAGHFAMSYSPAALSNGKTAPDLQVRVRVVNTKTLLGASDVRYNATASETLDVVLPATATGLQTEYDTLTGDIARYYTGKLADLQESADPTGRQDISYLASKTQSDARLLAMAALAEGLSVGTVAAGATAPTIGPAWFYALIRAGLPADQSALYRADTTTIAAIWNQAIAQGVIPGKPESIPDMMTGWKRIAAQQSLTATAPSAVSPLKDLLSASGLTDSQQQDFAAAYAANRGDPDGLWNAVGQGSNASVAARLQVDGKLAFLTMNNAPLMSAVRKQNGDTALTDVRQLAQNGYYRADKWLTALGATITVPASIQGDTPDTQRANYADYLAAQLRLSYPTTAVAAMVKSGELPVSSPDQVSAFLTQHDGAFDIGSQPVAHFIKTNNLQVDPDTVTQVKHLQRMYQIAPSDQALTGLLHHGFDSSYQITQQDKSTFIKTVSADVGGDDRAALVYEKARQTHNTALNIAISYLTARQGVPLGASALAAGAATEPVTGQVLSPAPNPPADASAAVVYPTLEQLFGAMDFCACEDCRSVLSPAAYLVDLLQFLDREPGAGNVNPQQALLGRRPDLQHLPLTCENTNTPLPYIDIVNETLEYFVANTVPALSLQGYTGHDTRGVATEDLMARPQYVLDAAYTALNTEYFPPPLPFDRSLANLRELFGAFGTPLATAMEQLRSTDTVEAGSAPYGWRDILMEQLELSPQENTILTDSGAVPLPVMYGLAAGTTDADAIAALSNAKNFAQRMGVSYEDLVALLGTQFVNPAATITLVDPTHPTDVGDFENMEFRDSAGGGTLTALSAPAFVRIMRFIRLWQKTGWSIHRTDAAICALYNADLSPVTADQVGTVAELDTGFQAVLPRLGVASRALTALGTNADRALLPLLASWSTIDTAGEESLYHQMFTAATVAGDTAFAPDSHGAVLQDPTVKLVDHTETLRAAFNLTADELSRTMAALTFDSGTPLTLANISAVSRRGWLARALRLSVRELLALTTLTGLDPFALPDPAQPDIIALIALVATMRQNGLAPSAALYLIWNDDISGKSAPDPAWSLELARTLRGDLTDIDDQLAATADAAETFMAQVYGQPTSDTFFGLLDGTTTYDVPFTLTSTSGSAALPTAVTAAGIAYDDFTHRLSCTGALTDTTRTALQAIPGITGFSAAVGALFARYQDLLGSFFRLHPELTQPYDTYQASTAPIDQKRGQLLDSLRPVLADARKRQQVLQRLSAAASVDLDFTTALLDPPAAPNSPQYPLHATGQPDRPVLDDLIAVQTAGFAAHFYYQSTATGAPAKSEAAESLDYAAATDHTLPPNPIVGQPISAAWNGLLEAPESGNYNLVIETDASAVVTLSVDGTNQILVQDGASWRNNNALYLTTGQLHPVTLTVTNVTSTMRVQWETPKQPREAISGRYLYPPATVSQLGDTYVRFLKLAALASTLQLSGTEIAHFGTDLAYLVNNNGWLNALPVDGVVASEVSAQLLAPLNALLGYASIKAVLSADDDQLLAALQTAGGDATPLLKLTGWDGQSLTDLLSHLGRSAADLTTFSVFRRVYDAFNVLAPLGIPAAAAIRAATTTPDAATVNAFENALRARTPAASMIRNSSNATDPATMPGFGDALQARIQAENDWRSAIRPVNDTLRDRSRDALVAYILRHLSASPATAYINTADKLFEYFLMDVQMDACMLTSRIRHALSSVQLFTQRCLMNLEPGALLSADAAQQWSWMNRYRMWEANRKVFLWPENWLDPELRDDKSTFFSEAESDLQQSDVTVDSVTAAYLNYLAKLEEVAKLEPCGTYYAPATADSDEVFHVVARTAGAHRKYFSRRYEYGAWTPWEQIKLDIEDNPVIPYVWQGRLLLFWLRLIRSAPATGMTLPPGKHVIELSTDDLPGQQGTEVGAVLCWSEYYNGKWQAAKTSDVNQPTYLDTITTASYNRSGLRLRVSPEGDALRIFVNDRVWEAVGGSLGGKLYLNPVRYWPGSFLFHNTHSLPVRGDDGVPVNMIDGPDVVVTSARSLAAVGDYDFALNYTDTAGTDLTRDVLNPQLPFEVVTPCDDLTDEWDAPLFFADSRHAYVVETSEQPVWMGGYQGYGLPDVAGGLRATAISPVTLPSAPTPPPKTWPGTGATASGGALIDPAAATRLLSEDTHLQRVLPDTATVSFKGQAVGPWGAQSDNTTQQ
jgi:hypothetical protein